MTAPACIGIYSPGEMGQAVGAVLAGNGLRVVAALEGRSARTRLLAAQAPIEDVGSLEALAREAGMVLSILVPGRAEEAARAMAAAMEASGARPLYVDCNAVAAETTIRVGEIVARAGAPFVDASIIGPPPRKPGLTRFYASGPDAPAFAVLAAHGLDVRVLDGPLGQASALKTAYAGLNKGLAALGASLLVYARMRGLDAPLAEELRLSQPDVYAKLERVVPITPARAHRFVAEMEEHGRALRAAGLPPGMMEGAAAWYAQVAATPLGAARQEEGPRHSLEQVVALLAEALAG